METQQPTFQGYSIGVDLGGSKIEVILSKDEPLNVVHRKREACEKDQGYEHLLAQITCLIQECINIAEADNQPIRSIGMGIPGSINPKTKLVRNCNVTIFNGKPLEEELHQRLKIPVQIQNDANCFTLSEAVLGAGKGYENVLGIILGTGLGGGLVINQKIHLGRYGYAAEIGHTSIDYDGIPCWCGNKGCIENYISGTGIERIYRQHKPKNDEIVKAPTIYQRYLEKDSAALSTFDDYFRYFGRSLANLIYTFDPEVIVLGGGASQIPLLYEKGEDAVRKHFQQEKIEINIVKNELGDSSGVFGALLMGL